MHIKRPACRCVYYISTVIFFRFSLCVESGSGDVTFTKPEPSCSPHRDTLLSCTHIPQKMSKYYIFQRTLYFRNFERIKAWFSTKPYTLTTCKEIIIFIIFIGLLFCSSISDDVQRSLFLLNNIYHCIIFEAYLMFIQYREQNYYKLLVSSTLKKKSIDRLAKGQL